MKNNDAIYFSQSGSGPHLALLHGWGLHGGIWQPVLSQLEAHFTITNVDLPGFGHSRWTGEEYSIHSVSNQVANILPERCLLLGWSLGGMIATQIAADYSEKIAGLITVASSPKFVKSDDWSNAVEPNILNTFIDSLSTDYKATLERFLAIQSMGSKTQKQDIAALKKIIFDRDMPDQKALTGGLNILRDADLRETIHQLPMPLLRLYGRLDTLVPVGVVDNIDNLAPNSSSQIFKRSGHSPFLSESPLFIDSLVKFKNTLRS